MGKIIILIMSCAALVFLCCCRIKIPQSRLLKHNISETDIVQIGQVLRSSEGVAYFVFTSSKDESLSSVNLRFIFSKSLSDINPYIVHVDKSNYIWTNWINGGNGKHDIAIQHEKLSGDSLRKLVEEEKYIILQIDGDRKIPQGVDLYLTELY